MESDFSKPNLQLDDFRKVLTRIRPYVKKTALWRCEALEKHLQIPHRLFLKLENQQPTNSFKVRGAFNALLNLPKDKAHLGIVTRSSGNFAQAIAYAGQLLHIKTRIVMPTNAPEVKKTATKRYEPELIFAGTTHQEANLCVEKIASETGATILSPYNHGDVIQGQGTISLEVFEELPTIRQFFCPIGGGGLLSGCATACKQLNPNIEVIGIEPEGAGDYYLSRKLGHSYFLDHPSTICDGLRANEVGSLNRPLLDRYVDTVHLVPDLEIMKTMRFLKNHCDQIIEPSGAAALAGLMLHKHLLKGDAVCVISGGNVDPHTFEECMEEINHRPSKSN